MTNRKEEERNEKIIRGLMKLPPNRRCINCNSLGPQYVCTNFWTFVCMTCSGIHREFTHRVKSVSMSKFTSQEVDALQKGGNQRARETYLKDWDPQRQRFPDNSNAEKVRQFIKSVYVDRKYAVGKTTDKPPRDGQNLSNMEDETRRSSSYHSYSQSPPYDYQYEERRYGKQAPSLTRKPGSDRGFYEGKISSFLSPSRLSDHVSEDRFANEGSNSGVSDYSLSSGGDPFRSDTQSPNFQRDSGFSSPSSEISRDNSSLDVRHHRVNTFSDRDSKRDAAQVQHPQRTASSGSFGSFNSDPVSLKSVNSVSTADIASEPEQSTGTIHSKMSPLPPSQQSSVTGTFGGLDLFDTPYVPQTVSSTAVAIDLFQLPEKSSTLSVDLFQQSPSQPLSQTAPSSQDLFSDMPQQQSAANLNERSSDVVIQKNEGWATFDKPHHTEPSQVFDNFTPATIPSMDRGSLGEFDQLLSLNTSPQWSSFQDIHEPSPMPNLWHESLQNFEAPLNATSAQPSWNAFEDSSEQLPFQSIHQQQSSEQVAVHNPSSFADQYLGFSVSEAGAHSHAADRKSTNPFDHPYDSDIESSNKLLHMSSLQDTLPNGQMSTSFIGDMGEPWFPQNPVAPYIPTGPQGTLGFMAGSAPITRTQIQNIPTQGPVASIGGNPFA